MCMKLPSVFLLVQLTADWLWDDMATVMNKSQFLSTEKNSEND